MATPKLQIVTSDGPAPVAVKIKDAAVLLSVSESSIYRLLKAGRLRRVGRGRLTRVSSSSIYAYIEEEEGRNATQS